MTLQELIDLYLKPSPYVDGRSCYERASEFLSRNSLQNEVVPLEIVQFIEHFAKGDAFKKADFNAFYDTLDQNPKLRNAILSIINEIAMDIYSRHQEEIQGFVAQIESQVDQRLPLSFAAENCLEKYRAFLNIYCLVRDKKLPISYDAYDTDSHFCRYQSPVVFTREIPFAINALTLMNKLPKEGNYCGIEMGEPLYPIFKKREANTEIPLGEGIKAWKTYFPFKQVTKIEAGDTGNNTFLATNGKKILFVRGSSRKAIIYKQENKKTPFTTHHAPRHFKHYSSQAVLASKIATFVSREHFASERLLSNSFSGSKKHPNYVLSYAKNDVRDAFKDGCETNPGAGIVDEVLNFIYEGDVNVENYGFSTNRLDAVTTSVVCKIDFDSCDLATSISQKEYERNLFTTARKSTKFKKTSRYYEEKLYSRLKLAVMSKEFILALTEKAYPENSPPPKETNEIAEKELVIAEVINRTEIALNIFLESLFLEAPILVKDSKKTEEFLRNNPDVFNRLLRESIKYILGHFEEKNQDALIKSIEKRIQLVNKEVQNKFKNVQLNPLVRANTLIKKPEKNKSSKQEMDSTINTTAKVNSSKEGKEGKEEVEEVERQKTSAFDSKATQALQNLIDTTGETNFSAALVKQITAHIDAGADPTIRQNGSGNSILMLVILYSDSPRDEHIEYLLKLYANYSDVLNYRDNIPQAGNTALMLAIKKGFYSLAIQLLKKGADPNVASDIDGFCPLHIACALLGTATINGKVNYEKEKELTELIHELIKHNADIRKPNAFGTTPLDFLDDKKFTEDDSLHYEKPKTPLGIFAGYPADLVLAYERQYLQSYPYEVWDFPRPIAIFEIPEQFASLHLLYKDYALMRGLIYGKVGDEVTEILKPWEPKLVEFLHVPSKENLSLRNIFDMAKTDPAFQHLTTKEAVEQECLNPNGVIRRPTAALDVTHAAGMNDLRSLVASVAWHRGESERISADVFFQPRQLFYSAEFGRSTVAEIKGLVLHKRTMAFINDIEKEIIRINGTSYGDENLKQNKIALLKFLQDCAEKINPMNFSEMICNICEWSIKEIDDLKKEIEKDYGVTLKDVNLLKKEEIKDETIYSLLSKKRKVYKSTVFEFFNDAEPKSKQLIDKYKKPDIDEKYGTYAESLGPRCS